MRKRKVTPRMLKKYEDFLTEEEKCPATIEKYMRDIEKFAEFAQDLPIEKELVILYKEQLKKEYELTSANSMLVALNGFLAHNGLYKCRVNLFKVQQELFCAEEKELSKEEYKRLLRAARQAKKERLWLVLQIICLTGIRVSELEYITVEGLKRGKIKVYCKGKVREIMVPREISRTLLLYAAKCGIYKGQIFVTRSGKPLDRSNIWREMKNLCKSAGVLASKVFPHNLRHLFARTYYAIKKDLAKLADVLGHSRIETTRIYIVSSGAEHAKIIDEVESILSIAET